jgi:ribosomal protein S6--L-glutamate ligase
LNNREQLLNILVIGERDWYADQSINFHCEKIFSKTNILFINNEFRYLTKDFDWVNIDAIIWRGQFEVEPEIQRYLLEIINVSNLPCINSPNALLNFGSNIAMYNALLRFGLPIIKKDISYGISSLDFYAPTFPCVLKIGDYHMGYAKALARNKETWQDYVDLSVTANKLISIEQFVNYVKDIRCLSIDNEFYCIERVPSRWKANVCPTEVKISLAPQRIIDDTINFSTYIGAEILGLDWIMDVGGNWYVLEGNLSPGLDMINPSQNKMMNKITEMLIKKL